MRPKREKASEGARLENDLRSCVNNKQFPYKGVDDDLRGLSRPNGRSAPETMPDFWSQAQKIVVARRMLSRGVSRLLIEPVLGIAAGTLLDEAADLRIEVSERKVRIGSGQTRLGDIRSPPVGDPSDDPVTQRSKQRAPLMSLREHQALVSAWVQGIDISTLAIELDRTVPALKRKARSLGLMGRQREDLIREFNAARPRIEPSAAAPPKPARKIYSWSPPATRYLCELWVGGTRPGDIAKTLGASPSSVSTRAVRLGLPARVRAPDGSFTLAKKGHVLFDPVHREHFWSPRSTATQSAWRTIQAG